MLARIRHSGKMCVSGDAFKDQSFGEDVFSGGALKGLAEVLARIRHAGRICLAAEVLSRMSHAGRTCLAEVLSRASHAERLCLAGVFSRISHDVKMNASGRRERVRQPSGRGCSLKCPFHVDNNDISLENARFT